MFPYAFGMCYVCCACQCISMVYAFVCLYMHVKVRVHVYVQYVCSVAMSMYCEKWVVYVRCVVCLCSM